MIVTDMEMAQATLEIFAGCICLMLMLIIIMNGHLNESMKTFAKMFVITALLFFSEACAYIFRGNINTTSVVCTRISNFLVFGLNIILALYFVRYIYCLLEENNIKLSKVYKNISYICFIIIMVILVINIFTGWMYYFDKDNYYHRNILWYIYTVVNLTCLFTGWFAAFKHRKDLPVVTVIVNTLFSLMPIIAIVIQSYVYGFSITNIGIAIGIIIILIDYLIKWKKAEYVDRETDEKKRKLLQIVSLFIIMVVSMSASIISCLISIHRMSSDNSKDSSIIMAHMVADKIHSEFIKPISISETMSRDTYVLELFNKCEGQPASYIEQEMKYYLSSIKNGFGYQSAFIVCDDNDAYYTYQGILKYIDIEKDVHDIWYKDFVESGALYEFNVDTDESDNFNLSVFVNTMIKDKYGHFAGACGVAVDMSGLQQILKELESEYNLKIVLADKNGLVQISSDGKEIENATIDNSYFSKVGTKEFYYSKDDKSSKMTKHIEDFNWYLVVEDFSPNKIDVKNITLPSIVIFLVGLFVMAIAFGVITTREEKIAKELKAKKLASMTDELTGLLNRHAYEEEISKLETRDNLENVNVIMMDLNGLKFANDNFGHNGGDELIIGAANCMEIPFNKYGKVFRIGGDEFMSFIYCSKEKAIETIETFDHITSTWSGKLVKELSVSKGVVYGEDNSKLSIREMIEISDKLMYADKDAYYERTGKKRRK